MLPVFLVYIIAALTWVQSPQVAEVTMGCRQVTFPRAGGKEAIATTFRITDASVQVISSQEYQNFKLIKREEVSNGVIAWIHHKEEKTEAVGRMRVYTQNGECKAVSVLYDVRGDKFRQAVTYLKDCESEYKIK